MKAGLLDNRSFQLLEQYLSLSAQRQEVLAANVANIDTPGYRTRDLDFRGELERAAEGGTTHRAEVREVSGLVERPDGNNVSLEREGMLLAETQLHFRIGVQLLRTEFRRLQVAINEGK